MPSKEPNSTAAPTISRMLILSMAVRERPGLIWFRCWHGRCSGMRVEPVFGIKGRGDGRLMFERGEANIDYQTTSGYLSGTAPLVEEGRRRSYDDVGRAG